MYKENGVIVHAIETILLRIIVHISMPLCRSAGIKGYDVIMYKYILINEPCNCTIIIVSHIVFLSSKKNCQKDYVGQNKKIM